MDASVYLSALQRIADEFRSGGVEVSLHGEGRGRFLLVQSGGRGAELYWGDDGVYFVDPAEGEELLGEVGYRSVGQAVTAVWWWLRDARRPMPLS